MKLSTRISLFLSAMTLLTGITSSWLIVGIIKDDANENAHKWAQLLTTVISEGLARDTINGNSVSARQTLDNIVNQNVQIRFAFVTDFDGHVFVHTFKDGFPEKILNSIARLSGHESSEDPHVDHTLDRGQIHVVYYPVINGMEAYLYLGFDDAFFKESIGNLIQKISVVIGLIVLAGIFASFSLSRHVARPLQALIGRVRRATPCLEQVGHPQEEDTGDEIETLISAFDAMDDARQQAEKDLVQFKNTLDMTLDCVFMFDPDTLRFIYVNTGAMQQVGYSDAELLQMTPVDIKPKMNEESFRALLKPLMEGKMSLCKFETLHRHKDGTDIPVEIAVQYIAPAGENPRYVAIVRDISERKKSEYQLQSALKLSESIITTSPIGIAIFNASGRCIATNESLADIMGAKREQLLEQNYNTVPTWKTSGMLEMAHEAIDRQRKVRREFDFVTTFGKRTVFDCIMVPFSNFGEQHLLCMIDEIFDRKQAENIIKEAYASLESRVRERTKDLEEMKQIAEKANHAKSEFLCRMSHELRTPMNAILGFGQLLGMEADDLSDTQKDNVNEILFAGHHLLDLINEVLDLASIDAGKMRVSREEVHVGKVIEQTIAMVRNQARERDIEIIDEVARYDYVVMADAKRLKQVLLNLLSNAVKYNCEGGKITMKCEVVDGERLRFSVTDSGMGLTEEQVARLFMPFERLDNKANIEGAGIGLVVSKHLMELMGGAIGVESTAGTGSTFWIEFEIV